MKKHSGYTIIELVIVVLLVAVMAAVAIPNFIDLTSDARTAVTKERLQAIRRAIVGDSRVTSGGAYTFPGFKADLGRIPTALSELTSQGAMTTYDPVNRSGWRGPYIDNTTLSGYGTDAWGTAIVYSTSPTFLRSWGPNKTDNTGGSDDISVTY